MTYVRRALETTLRRAARDFPAVVVTGPRQSGKTTILQRLFGRSHGYVSVEPPDVRAAAVADPRGFLAQHPPPVVLDEIQWAPDLLPYIKEEIDRDRQRGGRFILTGSQNLLLLQQVTETLAGRAAILRLLPMSVREMRGTPTAPLSWERRRSPAVSANPSPDELWSTFLRGGYPELATNPDRDPWLWHQSYLQTYLERDVRALRQVGDLTSFQNFLRVLAARSAQILVASDVARDLGIAVNTVKAWLSVLEASYQIRVVRPYFANVGKRLVKSPKVFFTDTGTLCHLVGLRDPAHARAGPMAGAILETAVLAEITRTLSHRGEVPQVYFWRTSTGSEVDFLVESGDQLIPIEVKLTATPRPALGDAIRRLRADVGEKAGPGLVVHSGESRLPLGPDVRAVSFVEL